MTTPRTGSSVGGFVVSPFGQSASRVRGALAHNSMRKAQSNVPGLGDQSLWGSRLKPNRS
jgi:hypothetical protein